MITIHIKTNDVITQTNIRHGSPLAAGYDIQAISDPIIVGDKTDHGYREVSWIQYHTGIHLQVAKTCVPNDILRPVKPHHILLFPRSSVRKYNLQLANSVGVVDADYTGELLLCFNYIWQPEDLRFIDGEVIGNVNFDRIYKKTDYVAQMILSETNLMQFERVATLSDSVRGSDGFGSSDAT